MNTVKRLAVALLVLAVLSVAVPEAGGPQVVPVTDASTGWHTKTLDWWVDYGLWKVKHSVSWQVKDDAGRVCYTFWNTEPARLHIQFITDPSLHYGRNCHDKYSGWKSSAPIRNVTLACWAPYSVLVDVRVDRCGSLPSVLNDQPNMEVVGSIHRACFTGDVFRVACASFKSKLTIWGRGVYIWNSAL